MSERTEVGHKVILSYPIDEELQIKEAKIVLQETDPSQPSYQGVLYLEFDGFRSKGLPSASISIYIPGVLDKLGEEGRKMFQQAILDYRKHMRDV